MIDFFLSVIKLGIIVFWWSKVATLLQEVVETYSKKKQTSHLHMSQASQN